MPMIKALFTGPVFLAPMIAGVADPIEMDPNGSEYL